MDTFPQELIDRISSFLTGGDLRRTLLVSRKFQLAAEQFSGNFAHFTFRSHDDAERQKFLVLYGAEGRRLQYLRSIQVRTSVPPTTGDPNAHFQPCREPPEELERKDEGFTAQIRSVWGCIHAAERNVAPYATRKIELLIYTPVQSVDEGCCEHRSYSSWRVHLLDPHSLPELCTVQALTVCNPEDRITNLPISHCKLGLRVILDLACRLPNLEYLACRLGVDEWIDTRDIIGEHHRHDFPGCRRDARNGFAAAIQTNPLPTSLQVVRFDFINDIHQPIQQQIERLPNLVAPNEYDPFSSSLRILTYGLRRMDLHAVTDESLFWPHGNEQPHWPNMESIKVLFHISMPCGRWYFQSPLGEGKYDTGFDIPEDTAYAPFDKEHDEEWCYNDEDCQAYAACTFRVVPIDENLVPFLHGFARAAKNMPRLVEACLWAPLSFYPVDMDEEEYSDIMDQYGGPDFGWAIRYNAPRLLGSPAVTPRNIQWIVGSWRPSHDLHQAFKQIGAQQHGSVLEESWQESGAVLGLDHFDNVMICPPTGNSRPRGYPTYSEYLKHSRIR